MWKARDMGTDEIVALKQVKFDSEMLKEGFPVTAMREISVLLALSHECIVTVKEMVVGNDFDKVFMVMEVSRKIFNLYHIILQLVLMKYQRFFYSRYFQLVHSVYGNGSQRSHEEIGNLSVPAIRTQKDALSNTIRYKSYP